MAINALRLKKSLLVGLGTWLNKQGLTGRQSRYRTRFVAQLVDCVSLLEKERMEIIKRHVEIEKNEEGEEVWKKTGDNFVIKPDSLVEFNQEISDLYDEDFIMDVTPETVPIIASIRDILLNTDYVFGATDNASIKETNDYDIWCEAFEGLKLEV